MKENPGWVTICHSHNSRGEPVEFGDDTNTSDHQAYLTARNSTPPNCVNILPDHEHDLETVYQADNQPDSTT